MTKPKILATGNELIRTGNRSTESVIEDLIKNADDTIHIMAYLISEHATKFLNLIEQCLIRGVAITVVINDLYSTKEKKDKKKKIRNILLLLNDDYDTLTLADFNNSRGGELHAKIIVVDRETAVFGSANFSFGGMSKNYELGIQIEGDPAWQLAKAITNISKNKKLCRIIQKNQL